MWPHLAHLGQSLTPGLRRLYGCAIRRAAEAGMKTTSQIWCVLTDSHFLIPLAVFVVGVAMLIAVH
jgi:hypothetical protein